MQIVIKAGNVGPFAFHNHNEMQECSYRGEIDGENVQKPSYDNLCGCVSKVQRGPGRPFVGFGVIAVPEEVLVCYHVMGSADALPRGVSAEVNDKSCGGKCCLASGCQLPSRIETDFVCAAEHMDIHSRLIGKWQSAAVEGDCVEHFQMKFLAAEFGKVHDDHAGAEGFVLLPLVIMLGEPLELFWRRTAWRNLHDGIFIN